MLSWVEHEKDLYNLEARPAKYAGDTHWLSKNILQKKEPILVSPMTDIVHKLCLCIDLHLERTF